MQRPILGFLIALLSFATGMSSVWIDRNLPSFTSLDTWMIEDPVAKPRFTYIGLACETPEDLYLSRDDQVLRARVTVKSSAKAAMAEFRKLVSGMSGTVIRLDGDSTRSGSIVTRYLVQTPSLSHADDWDFTILRYDGRNKYEAITAPTEQLLYEFEDFLVSD